MGMDVREGGGGWYLAVGACDVDGPPGEGVLQEAHELVDPCKTEVDHGGQSGGRGMCVVECKLLYPSL